MSFLNELTILLKARYPILYISTYEEERAEYLIKYCAKKFVIRTYYSWDFVEGYRGNPTDKGFASKNPLEALEIVDKLTTETAALFVLKDYDNFLKDISIIRKLKNLSRVLKTQPKNFLILTHEVNLPESLKEIVTVLELPLPNYDEILDELTRLTVSLNQNIEANVFTSLVNACQGLSLERIRRVLSKILAQYGEINAASSQLILEEKQQIIQQTQLLEFCLPQKNISQIGGLDNFKTWVSLRSKAFSQAALEYGLPYPKGLLLIGVQGTGKSIAARVIADEWNLPLLRLDFGRLFGSLVGQSESRVRKMIQIAEAMSPCVLWVEEIDKAFAGAQTSGDSGTTSRVLATFITWLSEKSSPVFVVATANNIEWIPPEIIRKGRFDEVFFFALPSKEERAAIFNVHLTRFRPQAENNTFQLSVLSSLSQEFSGAEIEQVVIEAMRIGFNDDREFTNEDLIISIQNLIPLARTKSAELNLLKEWSQSGNIVNASKYI